jgi:death-on-curing protein
MDDIRFLTYQEVLEIHADQLARYGGLDGFIDRNVVMSAIAQPQMSMFGQYLHKDLAEMAGAYLFHFAAAQGFVDGNKRTGAACADVFLQLNGYELTCTDLELYDITMQVATGRMDKTRLGDWIRVRMQPLA